MSKSNGSGADGTPKVLTRTLRGRGYAALAKGILGPALLKVLADPGRIEEGRAQWRAAFHRSDFSKNFSEPSASNGNSEPQGKRIWWHAASVGELEILWPVILALAKKPQSGDRESEAFEFILTVFSQSAKGRLEKLKETLERESNVRILFCGYSPWEGEWQSAIRHFKPSKFVTSKYEAWPELWMALSESEIPLTILSAQDRRSLQVCRRICEVLGARVPRLNLLTVTDIDAEALRMKFPSAEVQVVGETRWDQVDQRARSGSARVRELVQAMEKLPRPWGVLGSAWASDLMLWKNLLAGWNVKAHGTVWIVPHRIDGSHFEELKDILKSAGISYIATSLLRNAESFEAVIEQRSGTSCILVDEMGFLSELYASVDWAYVGGGFQDGVHSTIEPAIHGIPVACGPAKIERFTEIAQLRSTGQLEVLQDDKDLASWVKTLGVTQKDRWRREAQAKLGATDRIVRFLTS